MYGVGENAHCVFEPYEPKRPAAHACAAGIYNLAPAVKSDKTITKNHLNTKIPTWGFFITALYLANSSVAIKFADLQFPAVPRPGHLYFRNILCSA